MIKVGGIFSETQFYVVEQVNNGEVVVKDESGNSITITTEYVEKILNSADNFTEEKKVNQTELSEKFINSARTAMTVCFTKKDEPKSAKAIQKEKEEAIQKALNANVTDLPKILKDLVDNPIQNIIKGDVRVMLGRHYGCVDNMGRVSFIDMEIVKDSTKPVDTRLRLVDPRTLKYIIVEGIKYILK